MVNESDLKKLLRLTEKSGISDDYYKGLTSTGTGQFKKYNLQEVLSKIQKTIDRKAVLADLGVISKIRKTTESAVEGLMRNIASSFKALKNRLL